MASRFLSCLLLAALGAVCAGCDAAPALQSELPSAIESPSDLELPREAPDASGLSAEEISNFILDLNTSATRANAFARLYGAVDRQHLDMLHAAIPTLNGSGRWRLARVIGKLGSERSVEVLGPLIADPDVYVRRQAAWGLGEIGAESGAVYLERALDDEDDSVRVYAATALWQVRGARAQAALQEAARKHGGGLPVAVAWMYDAKNKGTRAPALTPGEISRGVLEDTQYLVYVPRSYDASQPSRLLVSVHGTDGIPEPYVDMCIADAERYGVVVLAPFFDRPTYPNYDLLELTGPRSDLRLLQMVDTLAKRLNIDADRFCLFGHSKGGQFVTRFVLAHPDRIRSAVASGSGHYAPADAAAMFPGGTAPNPSAPDLQIDFRNLVTADLAVVAGSEELDRRLDEYNRFKEAVANFAREHGIQSTVKFAVLDGAGHVGRQTYPRTAAFLLGDLPER